MSLTIIVVITVMIVMIMLLFLYMYTSNKKYTSHFYGNLNGAAGDKKIIKNSSNNNKQNDDLEKIYTRAGIYTNEDKLNFNKKKNIVLYCLVSIGVILAIKFHGLLSILILVFFSYMGLKVPSIMLNKRQKTRDEDILYYLPLVIEQLIVGVSSALDIGPCINYVVEMAEKRGTHNPVTRLLKQVQIYVRFGASLDDALLDVGRESGHTELKNAFLQLSQVAKHGGEITKQLQDLGTTVTRQREVIIDGRIKTLELKATGPVTLVFAGYMGILLTFLMIGILENLKV